MSLLSMDRPFLMNAMNISFDCDCLCAHDHTSMDFLSQSQKFVFTYPFRLSDTCSLLQHWTCSQHDYASIALSFIYKTFFSTHHADLSRSQIWIHAAIHNAEFNKTTLS